MSEDILLCLCIPFIHREVVDETESESAPAQAETAEKEEAEEEYFCPECGAKITLDMTHCPKCGCEFEFEEDAE